MLYSPVFRYSKITLAVFTITALGYVFTPKAFTRIVWSYFGENYEILEFSSGLGHYKAGVFVSLFLAMALLVVISFVTMLKTVFAYEHVKHDVANVKYYKAPAMLNRKEVASYLTLSSKYEALSSENSVDYRAVNQHFSHGVKDSGITLL